MAKFVYVYRGGRDVAPTPEEQEAVMAQWGAWFGELGAAVVDGGAPFAGSTSVSSSGRGDATSALGGYSIVNADSLDAAADLAKGCPIVAEGGSVDVYECHDLGM